MPRRSRLLPLGDSRQPSQNVKRLASLTTTCEVAHVDAAKIASSDLTLDKECILERSRVVSIAPNRMPYIGLHAKYNKRWYVDVVALPNNAIRLFLSHAFELISAVHRLALDMTQPDFDNVFGFLTQFGAFTIALFDAEDKILYPEVDSALKKIDGYDSHPLHPTIRQKSKKTICACFRSFEDTTLHTAPSMQICQAIQSTMDTLSGLLLEYFASKESELPRIIKKSIRGPKEKNRHEARLIKYFAELGMEMHYSALLISPLNLPAVREDFEERHFSKDKREEFRKATFTLENTLFSVPTVFAQAATKYESRFGMESFLKNYGKDRDLDTTTTIMD